MTDLNQRIDQAIQPLGIRKTAFADRVNVSRAFVSQLCSGVKQPSDRTIVDICREFNVNEEWLRTGKGEMFLQRSRDEELAAFFGNVLSGNPGFKYRFLFVRPSWMSRSGRCWSIWSTSCWPKSKKKRPALDRVGPLARLFDEVEDKLINDLQL